MKEKETLSVIEEGGLVVYADRETSIIKLLRADAEAICPTCGEIVALNGRCKTCTECGWSSCDV